MDNQLVMNKELENCNLVKSILMLLVLIYHSTVFWSGSWFKAITPYTISVGLSYFSQILNSFHIYCFVMVSGYIFSYLKYEMGKYVNYKSFILTKIKRLIIPYCFISIIWVIPISQLFYKWSISEIIVDFCLASNPRQLWFLWMLFDVFVFVWPLSRLLRNNKFAILFSLGSFSLGILLSWINVCDYFCVLSALMYIPFFVLGMKLRENKTCFFRKINAFTYLFLFIGLFVILQMINNKNEMIFKMLALGLSFIMHIIGALSAFFIIQFIANRIDWKNNIFIKTLSNKSMTIYLFHQQIIYLCIYVFNGILNPYMIAIINIIVSLSLSILISSVFMRFKLTRVLLGEKQ